MTSISSITSQPKDIADLQKAPSALSTALSFLTEPEKQECHLLSKTWDQLSKPVERGYGDFILVDKTGADVNFNTYKAVFSSLNNYLPQVHQQPLSDRLKLVNEEIHKIYPRLQAVFIPRALYELHAILSIYREELTLAKSHKECDCSKTCFHTLSLFAGTDVNNLKPAAIELAFRVNQFIVKELHTTAKGVTEIECQRAGQNILAQFKQMNEERLDPIEPKKMAKAYPIINRIRKGIMIDPINLQKAIALECSPESENSILLYRGSRFQNEPFYEENHPYCPCFGMSLFAGFMKDASACAGARMFFDEETVCSYSLRIPLEDQWQDAFCIPRVNTVCGLISKSEDFHARAKCLPPKDKWIGGYAAIINDEVRNRLVSPLPYSELDTQLKKYQGQRIEYALDPKRKRGIAPCG